MNNNSKYKKTRRKKSNTNTTKKKKSNTNTTKKKNKDTNTNNIRSKRKHKNEKQKVKTDNYRLMIKPSNIYSYQSSYVLENGKQIFAEKEVIDNKTTKITGEEIIHNGKPSLRKLSNKEIDTFLHL